MKEQGNISVHTENLFPIIKKFLYSDQEVFLRELVSNAVDATQKLKQLGAMGQYDGNTEKLKVSVSINEEQKTITISDQGIGMTAEDIKKYINQVAFSGATEFMEKYKDQTKEKLIGFFGLGFYSAFMVAEKVEIITKSHQKDAEAAHWTCEGSTQFEITTTEKEEVGTDVVLHLAEDAEPFLKKERIQQLLEKYCKFLPVEIAFDGKVINNQNPIWTKAPSELKEEDYLAFYKELYPVAPDPLFWIHLNVDYPFTLTGILYFPKGTNNFEQTQSKIQLYTRQVFITNEVKDVVPDFLMLLHGVIDSPDIPLNVSRSALQADSSVKKINIYITKKVSDKLGEIFKEDRAAYEKKWPSMELFIKYGMLTEEKFFEKAKEFALLKNTENKLFTLAEYQEKIKPNQTGKDNTVVMLYATAPKKQDQYIQSCTKRSYDVLVLDQAIDLHIINLLEQKLDKVVLKGVDAELVGNLIGNEEAQEVALTAEEQEQLKALYAKAVPGTQITWSIMAMAADELPVTITVAEFMKRMQHSMPGLSGGKFPLQVQANINANHPLVQKVLEPQQEEKKTKMAQQAYNLALLAQDMLQGSALTNFIQNSVSVMVEE
jgi:molecular chaperone HtpG